MMENSSLLIVIDLIGVAIGLVSIGVMVGSLGTVGGLVAKWVTLVLAGITLQVLALLWTTIVERLNLVEAPIDVHHLLMTIGMIFFVIAALKMLKIAK